MANLKRLTQAELLAFKQSPTISYEFYALVKEELERRKPIHGKDKPQKVYDSKKGKMVYGSEQF